jgi:ATP-binding cassette, subfamily C (CFTR/MRP), member 10
MSPIYAHFTETIQGMVTIRAMRETTRFRQEFSVKLEDSIKAQMTAAAAQQWLGLNLQFLGCLLVGGIGVIAATTSAHTSTPSLVGLAISYALSITSLLAGVLNALAETEQELIAVERVNQYCVLEPEPNAEGQIDPPFGWPCQGVISFKNVVMSYRENLTPSLKNINLEIQPCERLGIVGRTGAGKSSMLSALLRVSSHMQRGEISIDCINIAALPIAVLRSRIAIVPQEPFLFSGRIRDNLDPRELHLDSEIWKALNSCLASPLVQSLGGLNAQLESGGDNLSSGQKQLFCLTRALLKNSKIVLIDEGTANLDLDSDKAIQLVLSKTFKSSTCIFIAHRLTGLQNTDRIVVMNSGEIIEQGEPKQLAGDASSFFYQMLQEQQNTDY